MTIPAFVMAALVKIDPEFGKKNMTDNAARLTSLDAFRGFTIAAMVLVNNPGDWSNLYPQLAHAHWNGWTFTDTIFPFFLFIGGVSMALSLGRLAAAGADKPAPAAQAGRARAADFPDRLRAERGPLFQFPARAGSRRAAADRHLHPAGRADRRVLQLAPALAWIAGLLAAYSVLMLWVPVPGIGAGVLEPGQDFGAYIDRFLLGNHMWVQSKTWDPEGLVSTLPALCSQLVGVLAGRWLLSSADRSEQTVWMLLIGLLLLALGSTLDAILMPINKSLWTPSFCLFMSGWALVAFLGVLLAARRQSERRGARSGRPLEPPVRHLRHERAVHLRAVRPDRQDARLYQIRPAGRQQGFARQDAVRADPRPADRAGQYVLAVCPAV